MLQRHPDHDRLRHLRRARPAGRGTPAAERASSARRTSLWRPSWPTASAASMPWRRRRSRRTLEHRRMTVHAQPAHRCARQRRLLSRLGVQPGSHGGSRRADRRSRAKRSPSRDHDARRGERAIERGRTRPSSPGASVPAPRRGELVRLLGEELRAAKADLGLLVTLEAGKIALGGSRRGPGDDRHLRLRGRAFRDSSSASPSRPSGAEHRMMETWHPLGVGRRHHRPSTFRSRSGPGTPRSRSSAATRWSGSPPRRRR